MKGQSDSFGNELSVVLGLRGKVVHRLSESIYRVCSNGTYKSAESHSA